MAKSQIGKRTKAAGHFDVDAAIVDALELAIHKTPKSIIIQKLRQGAESDDDFRRWLVLLFDPDLVSPFSTNCSTTSGSQPDKSPNTTKLDLKSAAQPTPKSAKPSSKPPNNQPSFDVLVESTRQAIEKATEVDLNRINYNFRYDYQAYEEVQRNLIKLIELDRLDLAMQLAIELMKKGSHQMEMSDEGLMVNEIEECLNPVIDAVKASSLSAIEKLEWRHAMNCADCIGCVCDTGLRNLEIACKENPTR